MFPKYQRNEKYHEIELQRYFQSEHRDDCQHAMVQYVNEREEKKRESVRKFFLKAW